MKKIFNVILLLFFTSQIQAEIIVIGNKSNLLTFSSAQIENIFMGRNRTLSNGMVAVPLDQIELRQEFYRRLVHQPLEQVDAYWNTVIFTNKIAPPHLPTPPQPPKILLSDKDVLKAVNEDKNAIGYIDKTSFDNSVRILLVIN